MNNNIQINIISKRKRIVNNIPCYVGEIVIHKINTKEPFKETFDLPLEWWSFDDYKRQWKEGLEKIKTHNQSCLVTEVQDPNKAPLVNWWMLYKIKDTIHVQNHMLFKPYYIELIGDKPFTPDTCYNYITPYASHSESGYPISEWIVELDDHK